MNNLKKLVAFFVLFNIPAIISNARADTPAPFTVAMSAVKGGQSKPKTVELPATKGVLKAGSFKVSGPDKGDFKVISFTRTAWVNEVVLAFAPPADFVGVKHAKLTISNAEKVIKSVELTGLSINGLEGPNEPPLAVITDALGYHVNVGWTTLANNTKPELFGDEIDASLFKKAGKGVVEIIPVARFSPDGEVPFGYYINTKTGPELHQAGILAKTGQYVQHQTISPDISSGTSSVDPGESTFGLYATTPDHSAFSEDVWNMLYGPDNAVRSARVYPVKGKNGQLIKNAYLVCYEEAKNGDYNDLVFLVKNVAPVMDNLFTTIFDGKSLNGWHSYLKGIGSNTDPNRNFRLEDGTLHVIGKDLGYEISDKGFFNFHAKLEFKWGVSKWPPRENAKRDGGFLYNIPMSEPDSIWPKSIECQIQEGDVGDFWMLGFSTMTVKGKTNRPTNHIQFVKFKDNEKPYGEWNTVEVISYNGKCIQVVNGEVVNYGDNASVTGGRVILQSEYSEIYYRNVRIRQL